MYKIESFMNFRYNVYLTGTNYRSLKPDDAIFQLVYRKSHILGKDVRVDPNKDLIILKTKLVPTNGELWQIKRNDKTFKTFYNNIASTKDATIDYIMERFYHKSDLSLFKTIMREDGKIVFYCGRIDSCEKIRKSLIVNHNIHPDDIGIVNSSVQNKKILDSNKEKPFIITTISSLGRGYDDSRLRVLVYLELTFSYPDVIQGISKVGRIGGKRGYVIYVLDTTFPIIKNSFYKKLRNPEFRGSFKDVFSMEVPEDWFTKYYYGYRTNSEEAAQIRLKEEKKRRKIKLSKFFK